MATNSRQAAEGGADAGVPSFNPMAVAEVELTRALDPMPATDDDGTRYRGARLVVRLHTRTVGVVDVDLDDDPLPAASCAQAIWSKLAPSINSHLRADGLPEVDRLDSSGLAAHEETPACLRRRAAAVRAAPMVSAIICTRDRADLLTRTLASLAELEYPNFEILVIDGSQGPETRRLVEEASPSVRYMHIGAHGRSYALNRGINEARGEILALTDDDVRVDRHWLAELVGALVEDPRNACATGVAFPMELSTPAQLWFEESGGFTDGFQPRSIGLDGPQEPGSLLPYATGKIGAGVSMAWRRSVLRDIGGFDVAMDTLTPLWPLRTRHGSSGEDLSALFEILLGGYRIVFEPSAIVYHEHRRSYDELKRQIYWHGLGLSAHLTRCLLRHPETIPGFLLKVPKGMIYGFAGSSVRNDKKSAGFPRALTHAEWRGVLEGPFAYLKGLPRARRIQAGALAHEAR